MSRGTILYLTEGSIYMNLQAFLELLKLDAEVEICLSAKMSDIENSDLDGTLILDLRSSKVYRVDITKDNKLLIKVKFK